MAPQERSGEIAPFLAVTVPFPEAPAAPAPFTEAAEEIQPQAEAYDDFAAVLPVSDESITDAYTQSETVQRLRSWMSDKYDAAMDRLSAVGRGRVGIGLGRLAAATVVVGVVLSGTGGGDSTGKIQRGGIVPEFDAGGDDAPQLTDEECADTWAVTERIDDPTTTEDDFRLVGGAGVPAIREADTEEEAREAITVDFIDAIKGTPQLLASAIDAFTESDEPTDPDSLHANGCMTEQAKLHLEEVQLILASSAIRPGEAPSTAFNTGVDANGNVVRAAMAGITGDRAAAEIELPNGEKTWVMARCGNFVFLVPPDKPIGPTDETPETPTTTTTSTTSTTVPTTTTSTTSTTTTSTIPDIHFPPGSTTTTTTSTTAPPKPLAPTPGPTGTTSTTVEAPSGERRDTPAAMTPTTSTTMAPGATTSTTVEAPGATTTTTVPPTTTTTMSPSTTTTTPPGQFGG